MIGETSQTVEVERQREAEMFKLYEELTQELRIYHVKITEAEEVVSNFASRVINLAANDANAYPNELRQRQQIYFYTGLEK